MTPINYKTEDICKAYRAAGVCEGRVIFLTSDMGRLGVYEFDRKKDLLSRHLKILRQMIGKGGTLVVPTGCTKLVNTNIPFDLDNTPSSSVGIFSEYVRVQQEAQRSFHPFINYTAIGRNAVPITKNTSRHAFGPETPLARMLELDALCISVGREIRYTATIAHHAEFLSGVPYRYIKEFMHPVVRNREIIIEPFYLHVRYENSDVEREYQKKIGQRFLDNYSFSRNSLGRGYVWSYSMNDYYKHTMNEIAKNPYVWCKLEPKERPWQL